jgi:hypothetical protein
LLQVARDDCFAAQHDDSFHEVLELAHVPRPLVPDERLHRRRRDLEQRPVVLNGVFLDEELD